MARIYAILVLHVLSLSGRCDPRKPCAAGWYIEGINPAGVYRCRPVLGDPDRDIEDARYRLELPDDRRTYGWLYCPTPTTPRHDGARVWCER